MVTQKDDFIVATCPETIAADILLGKGASQEPMATSLA